MAKAKVEDTDDVAALKAEMEQYKARAISAEGQLDESNKKLRQAELNSMTAQERAIAVEQESCDRTISDLERQIEDAETRYGEIADEPGHGKDLAALSRQMAQAEAALVQEKAKKNWLATQREQAKGRREAQPKDVPGDVTVANGMKLSEFVPHTQRWLREHQNVMQDKRLFAKAEVAAQEAIKLEGLQEGTPEFYEFVEERLGLRQAAPGQNDDPPPDDQEGEEIETPPPGKKAGAARDAFTPENPQPRAAGPGSMSQVLGRPTHQTPQGSGRQVRRGSPVLSPDEREAAVALYPGMSEADALKSYADGKRYMAERSGSHFSAN